ncbi:MAG TPA: hypothetical protein VIU61_14650 [Kofleriaceae bacterium]
MKKSKRSPPKKRPVAKAKAKPKAKAKAKTKAKAKPRAKAKAKAKPTATGTRWHAFVEQHGIVLASARGPVPSVAEAIAGEPIVGSWWSHPKAQAIFDALSSLDDSDDIRCFKLVDGKITFVHRRLWPALARLAEAGAIERARVESIQQEHMPTGEHRNFTTPFPDWVPDDVLAAAGKLDVDAARAQLGSWAR